MFFPTLGTRWLVRTTTIGSQTGLVLVTAMKGVAGVVKIEWASYANIRVKRRMVHSVNNVMFVTTSKRRA
jgi:hypothetical protein